MWGDGCPNDIKSRRLSTSGRKTGGDTEKDWDKMNRMVCGIIRSCLTQDIKYHVLYETFARKIWKILEKEYLKKTTESRLHLKRRLYRFQLKRGLFIGERINNNTKLFVDLINMDVEIKEEDKAVVLLNSLPDEEYDTFILSLINNKQTLNLVMCQLLL